MSTDEKAIREVVALWHRATAAGDVEAVLSLMADDVVFLTAGQAPFGRDAFEKGLRTLLTTHRIESSAELREIRVSGDIAYCWAQLNVRIYPSSGGAPAERAGPALSVFRKQAGGAWRLARDANMVSPSADA